MPIIRQGISSAAVDALTKTLHVTQSELASALGIPERTLARRQGTTPSHRQRLGTTPVECSAGRAKCRHPRRSQRSAQPAVPVFREDRNRRITRVRDRSAVDPPMKFRP
uniref:Antitoxin Xre-like helix-turn-helix domain-containing protein n=1 Tax=mine drainage metagenome TaxID=410659 RepID=E6PWG1_9ZZZZ